MFLGIEIGGTKLQLGIGPGDGTILALERARVDPSGGAPGICDQIRILVPQLLTRAGLTKSTIAGVGFGFGGPVDVDRGVAVKSHQIDGWDGFPLADWCIGEFGWAAVVHNDADTAGLAEACFGAGRGYSPIFYITIGSGIGGGLIINQKIYRGAGAGAAEIGHLRLEPSRWGEGAIVESVASGWGIEQRARKRLELAMRGVTEPGALKRETLTVPAIAEAARKGDAEAQSVLGDAIDALGWAITHVIALVCPRRIIIGGGVSQIGEEVLFDPLRRTVAGLVFAPFAHSYEIVPAVLGEAVVVHGALRLARDACQGERGPAIRVGS